MNIKNLPSSVQDDIRATLQAYSTAFVWQRKDTGEYIVIAHSALHLGEYDRFIAEFTAGEVFTLEERIINYVNTFRDFPYHCSNGAHYTGKKDWAALRGDWSSAEMVNGNLVFK